MSEPAVALSFFDAESDLRGAVRSGLTLLFDGRQARAEHAEAAFERDGDGWHATAGTDVELRLTPTAEAAKLGGASVSIAAAEGRVAGRDVRGLGTIAETLRPPEWRELDSVRALAAVFGPDRAAFAIARRPRSAAGHGDELVSAALIEGGALLSPEDARISTVYDGGGRQHSAGLELWMPGDDDFPRRLFGTVQAGTSLQLEGLIVHAAAFTWRMEGHVGAGLYELTIRRGDDEPAAA